MSSRRPPVMSAHTVQKQMDLRRIGDNTRNELLQRHERDVAMNAASVSESRIEGKRRDRLHQEHMSELYQDLMIQQQEENERKRRILLEQEEKLAAEILRRRDEDIKKQASIRRIIDESDELKELHAKLKATVIMKERAVQMQQAELAHASEKGVDDHYLAEMEKRRAEDAQREAEERQKRYQSNLEARLYLEHQIEQREAERQKAYEEFLSQKEEVDKVVQQMRAQDEKEKARRAQKVVETQEYVAKYLEDRKRWKEDEKKKRAEEMAAIEDWNRKMEARLEALRAQKIKAASGQDAMLARISAEIEANRKQRCVLEETEQLLLDLFLEEKEAKAHEEAQKKEQKRAAMKQEMMEANAAQKAYKAQKEIESRAEEDEFRRRMMEKFAEDERIEQMSAAKRRERQLAHRRETDRLLEQRREMFEKEREIELQAREEQKQIDRYRRTVIEQERQRLLLEHAAQLREFLPRGVLKTREDVELVFGKDYVEQYGVGML